MKLSTQWTFWIALILLILTGCAQCRDDNAKSESFGAKFNRALNYFKTAFRGDEEDPLPPFDKKGIETHFQQKPQQDIEPPFPPKPHKLIEQRSLADYCSRTGPGARIQLGACSPTFVVCEREALRFEECPTGQVFVDGACISATLQPACFDASSNQLNHASEKLVQATSFCRVHSAPGFLHLAGEPNHCSRQALICLTHSRAVSIACPQGSVFDSNTLACQKFQTHPQCKFADKPLVQPIKTALERLYCAENHDEDEPGSSVPPPFPGHVRSEQISIANNGMRCKDWFVTCSHPEKEFVFCGQDSLFDKEQVACRPTRPTDNCPAIFNCRDFEWKIIPFGKCRPEFIFCRGLIPVQFQCRPGFVVFNSECVPEKSVREQCNSGGDGVPTLSECDVEGERKPDSSNCTCFHECQRDHRSILTWSNQCCKNGDGYDPNDQDCSSSFHCDSVCEEGQSFVVNCHEYFECRQKRFQAGVCPSMSSYSVEERRCVFDSTCKHPGDEDSDNKSTEECHEDEFVRSKDCISYGVCKQHMLHWKPCHLLNGQYHEQCPGCSAGPPSQKSAEAEPEQPPSDSSPTECTDGAVVLSKNECKRFMKCYAGHWLMVECPNDKFFSLKTQACTAETCEKSGIYLPPSGTPDQVPDYKPPIGQPWCNDTSCCTEKSPLLPVHEDCHKYQECDTKTGRYTDRLCPFDEHFSVAGLKCIEGSECEYDSVTTEHDDEYEDPPGECLEGSMRGLKKCGHLRLCLEKKWQSARCKNGMKFESGRCSKTETCDNKDDSKSKEKLEDKTDLCQDGQSKRHPYSCNKYLTCDHGVFTERVCSYGALFNPKNQRCDLNFECDYENQPKCYEGQQKLLKENCHGYLRCLEGKFVEETCPEKTVYDDEKKKCVEGKCKYDDESEESEESKSKEKKKKPKNKSKKKESHEYDDGAPTTVPCKESPDAKGYRRDKHRCGRFYQCSNGDWVPKTCPSGTVFNTHIGVCDWPRNVPGCEDD